MPTPTDKRNYKREREMYHGTPKQKANNAKRKRARYAMEKKGLVKKGDGKEVDHVKGITKNKVRVVSRHINRVKSGKTKSRGK